MSRITQAVSALFRRDALEAGAPMYLDAGRGTPLNWQGVNSQSVPGLSSVWRSLDILAVGVQQLPWSEVRGVDNLLDSRLVKRPQAGKTRREWVSQVVRTMALYDVCYLLKVGQDSDGLPISLVPLWPMMVTPYYTTDVYWYGFVPPEYYTIGKERVEADRIVIVRRAVMPDLADWSVGLVRLARTTFAAAMAAEGYASRYWQAGGSPVSVLTTDQVLPQTEIDRMKEDWANSRSRGPDHPAVATGGVKPMPYGADPTQEAAVEARREMVADVARYFGIPTRLINAPTGDTETYTASGDSNLDLLRFTLENYIGAIEDAITDQLPGGRTMQMDRTVLTRGSQLARGQYYQLASNGKAWMTPDEIRSLESLPPIESPDELNPPTPEVAPPPQQRQLSGGQGG